ncbi:MAG: hypothetical protein JXR51_05675 [Bacteroidales bacterium]|nr:hypothetical protein [Bacteroidales bacterium]
MKNFYNLFFSLNNLNEDENFLIDFDKKDDEEKRDSKFLNNFFEKTLFTPRKEVVDNIIEMLHKGLI